MGDRKLQVELLRKDDPSRPLFVPWSDETHARFDTISALPPDHTQILALVDAFVEQVANFVNAIEIETAGWTRLQLLKKRVL